MRVGPAAAGLTCARCGASLPSPSPAGTVTCPSCSLTMPVAALDELGGLTAWADWARARANWLRDRLASDDLPDDWSVRAIAMPTVTPVPTVTPMRPGAPSAPPATVAATPTPPLGVGTLLLVGGAVLLVLAGIAFAAVAWDLLGPIGQLSLLYAIGAVALLAGLRLHRRLPGTATTLGVVGALLVAVGCVATRVLGADPLGPTLSLAASLAAAVLLAAVGGWLRTRMRGVGEVAALTGAALALGLLASAPADAAVPLAEPWAWWVAAVLLLGGVGLLLLHARYPVVTWPALAALSLLVGSGAAAVFVAGEASVGDAVRPLVGSAVLLALAALSALLVRLLPEHRPEPALAAAVQVTVAALVAFGSGVAQPSSRPWSALALAAVAGVAWWARTHTPPGLRPWLSLVAAAALGTAVGLAAAPWAIDAAVGNGAVAGVALSAVLVVLAELTRESSRASGLAALVATGAGLLAWLMATVPGQEGTTSDAALWATVIALTLLGLAGWGEALRRPLPAWSVWLAGGLLVGALVPLGQLADLETPWAPEIAGAALGVLAGVSGGLFWWLRRPARTPSLAVVGPALALALAPTTIAVVQDALTRWTLDGGSVSTAYQVRVAALFVVGAALVVLGAWRRWAGVVIPAALMLVAVTAVQLVDLGRFLPQWVSFAVAGGLLVLAGARWESVRGLGRAGAHWLRDLR